MGKVKDLCIIIAERQDILLQNVFRTLEEGKEKERSRMSEGASEEDSEEGMPKKHQRESILYCAASARAQLQYRGYDGKEAKRRANVLRAT